MKVYWDSSALILALQNRKIRDRIEAEDSITRTHSLSEVFSVMTGGRLGFRCDVDQVATLIRELMLELTIEDLTASDMADYLDLARSSGVRGGGVYDYLHACTAVHFGCDTLFTLNLSDFEGLFEGLKVVEP